ncbi:MAG: type I restriction-modification system subunit M [Fimbriimonadaceae bacterium]|nr:type I restriction-modification system subunit M [Fimbriimonadaceae bacterium]
MSNPAQLVQKLWNYCSILLEDGLTYMDYTEQLTYLLFLKMADERSRAPFNEPSVVPAGYDWESLRTKTGDDLEVQYRHVLETLGKRDGMLGLIFRKAQNKIQDPAKLQRLIVDLMDRENWSGMAADVKGDAYEGLLEKTASEGKAAAGQYFTPRALIAALVDCMAPKIGETICDPACGTGGFLLASYDYLARRPDLDPDQKRFLKSETLHGVELVDGVTRLCAMNLLLHGVGSESSSRMPVETRDALSGRHGEYDMVLTNPPFGRKSSVTIIGEDGETSKESLTLARDDFWATTSNKQLNFVQHVFTILKQHGRAAMVVPDNVLFEGGAGETVRRRLLAQTDVHTLLRLPTGIFYAQGVKANVLFFDRKPASDKPWTKTLWIYDLRTNKDFTLKTRTLRREHLDEFVTCYNPANRHERVATWSEENPEGRWRSYEYEELIARDKANLDLTWLRDESLEDSANLPDPDVIAREIVEDLQAALEQFSALAEG